MKILYLGNRKKHETAQRPQFSDTTAQALPYLSSTAQKLPQNAVRCPKFAFICHKKIQAQSWHKKQKPQSQNPLMGQPTPSPSGFFSFLGYIHILHFLSKNTDFEFFWNPPKKFLQSQRTGSIISPPHVPDLISEGHSGEYGNAAKLIGKMSKSVMQLISINF